MPNGEHETWFAIHEVYYDENGKPDGTTVKSIDVSGDSIESMEWTLKKMSEALKKSILWGDDRFPEEYQKELV